MNWSRSSNGACSRRPNRRDRIEGLPEVTQLLERLRAGDTAAREELVSLVYDNLRRIAAGHLRHERGGHTLQPTALVHEAYLKIFQAEPREFADRVHFFAVASRVMRQVLIDYARAAASAKRTADTRLLLEHDPGAEHVELIDLDRAIDALGSEDPHLAQLIEMRYFGGMTAEETAEALGLSVHAVRHDLRLAQAWLRRELSR